MEVDFTGMARVSQQAYRGSFAFRKRSTRIDWRSLASVDIDRISREMDFNALQQNITNVTFCNIESEEFCDMDANFIKLFRLAQLTIEYLLHSQQYLSDQGRQLQAQLKDTQQQLDNTKSELISKTEDFKVLKKENRKRRKIIEAYQDMINAGATGLHPCPVCKREFVSDTYLQSHIHRRHPDQLPANEAKPLKEEIEKRLVEQMNAKLLEAKSQLRLELLEKEKQVAEEKFKEYEDWKAKEEEQLERKMENFRRPLLEELQQLQKAILDAELLVQEKQAEIEKLQARSHLGHLEGSQELRVADQDLVKTKEEVVQLKEQLDCQSQEMHNELKKQEKNWKRLLQKLSSSHQEQLKESAAKLEKSLNESFKLQRSSEMVNEVKHLQKKLKHQEQNMLSYQQQLDNLQRQSSTSPTPVCSLPETPQHSLPQPLSSKYDSDDEEGSSEDEDSVDFAGYTPFQNKQMIRTQFDHQPEVLENIKQETVQIFNDALTQRGVSENADGLTSKELEEKLKALDLERQQRMQTHFNFAEQRSKLQHKVEAVVAEYYGFKTTDKGIGKPPIMPKLTTSEPVQLSNSNKTQSPIYSQQQNVHKDTSLMDTGELVSPHEVSESIVNEEDSTWDSESISSEPLQHHEGMSRELVPAVTDTDKIKSLGAKINIDPDPSKRPPGGVAIFGHAQRVEVFDSDDSFGVTESMSTKVADVQHNRQTPAVRIAEEAAVSGKTAISRTATSQSALTSVSALDFDDSDFSDLETTHLT